MMILSDEASPTSHAESLGAGVDPPDQCEASSHKPPPCSKRVPSIDAIDRLEAAGYLPQEDAHYFRESYRFQISVEARIRLMDQQGRHELPTDPGELRKLAFLLGYAEPAELEKQAQYFFAENRARFNRMFGMPG